jgi:hypothetical protein
VNDGRKNDKGKPDWNLVPWKAMDEGFRASISVISLLSCGTWSNGKRGITLIMKVVAVTSPTLSVVYCSCLRQKRSRNER